ncbi:MAG TPA: DUF1501 domain-containing protein, partial [Planctomycetia bacterium]|nr:DUF1501 domain-containing protein [Planctomycetia bacterium]
EAAGKNYKPVATYPEGHFGQMLRTVMQMLVADLGTQIYYVSLGGFDTHAQQANLHANLLGQLSDGLRAFQQDLAGCKLLDRVAVLTFSEFGRRVAENGSLGTDHGAASQLFLLRPAGAKTGKSGLIGRHPSLSDLDDGDLKHAVDFRSVYATMLENWLDIPATGVLGKAYPKLDLI